MTQKRNEDRLMKMAVKIKETYQPAEIAQLVRLIEPTPTTGEMSAEGFESLMQDLTATRARRGFSEKSVEAARLVLVMGASISEAAADTGLTRQSVNQLMTRIRRRIQSKPDGWVKVDVWLPHDAALQVERLSRELVDLEPGAVVDFTITEPDGPHG